MTWLSEEVKMVNPQEPVVCTHDKRTHCAIVGVGVNGTHTVHCVECHERSGFPLRLEMPGDDPRQDTRSTG